MEQCQHTMIIKDGYYVCTECGICDKALHINTPTKQIVIETYEIENKLNLYNKIRNLDVSVADNYFLHSIRMYRVIKQKISTSHLYIIIIYTIKNAWRYRDVNIEMSHYLNTPYRLNSVIIGELQAFSINPKNLKEFKKENLREFLKYVKSRIAFDF